MLKKSELILIRHGRTVGNENKWYYGHADVELSDEGRRMTRESVKKGMYPKLPENADCYTTGLVRTEETFMIIYGDRPHGRIEALQEMNFGDYECKSWAQLQNDPVFVEWGYDTTGDIALPGGESRNQFVKRIERGLEGLIAKHNRKELELRHRDEKAVTVLVCHGGVIMTMMNLMFDGEKDNPWYFMPEPGAGYIVEFENGAPSGYRKIENADGAEQGYNNFSDSNEGDYGDFSSFSNQEAE